MRRSNLAVMVRPVDGAEELAACLADPRLNAVVLGPGGGRRGPPMRDMVLAALSGERAVVLDADALTSFADAPETLFAAITIARCVADGADAARGRIRAICSEQARQATEISSKCDRARPRRQASGAIVLLKGSDTVVAAPGGPRVDHRKRAALARHGGLRRRAGGIRRGPAGAGHAGFEAASAAVWLHGEAGSEAGPGLIAEDLPEALRAVYRRLFVDLGVWP